MDSRIYFHQYRRPRYTNPTYLSSNVGGSISFFTEKSPKQPNTYNFDSSPTTNSPTPPASTRQPNRYETSKLSGYGQRSLTMDQRGVYNKQTSKYDIINLKPLEHSQEIKQYPWFTVENRDDVYYRRMNQMYSSGMQSRSKTTDKGEENVAGKHTYAMEPKIPVNPEPQSRGREKFTAKMLNHMDELQHNLA